MNFRPARYLVAFGLAFALSPQPSHTGFPPLVMNVACGSSADAVALQKGFEIVLQTYDNEDEANQDYENEALLGQWSYAVLNAMTSYFECDRCPLEPRPPCARTLSYDHPEHFLMDLRPGVNGGWEIVLTVDGPVIVSVVCAEC